MKNKLFRLISLSVVLALAVSIFAAGVNAETAQRQYVYDPVYLLTDSEYAELNAMAAETSEKYGCAVHFVVTDDPAVNYDNIQIYSEDMYLESPALGYGEGKDGVMLVLGTADRCYWLLAYGEKGNYAFTDYAKDWMSEHFVDEFSDDAWYGGFKDYITDCDYILGEAAKGTPVDIDNDIGVEAYGFALVAGLIVAFIVCSVFKSQMKTANIATRATDYLDKANVDILFRNQLFRYSTVTRTKIETDNSSSSGGGTTVNSRGFSGKGGKF